MSNYFEVDLRAEDAREASALFLSVVARPEPGDEDERGALHDSLCAWMIRERCARDPSWANHPQILIPSHAARPEAHIAHDLKTLDRRLRDRLTAGHIAVAFLKKAESGETPVLPQGASRLSLNEMAKAVIEDLGMADVGNVLTRVWRRSVPVIHLCAAWAVSLSELDQATRDLPYLTGSIREIVFLGRVLRRAEDYVPLLSKSALQIEPERLIRLRPWGGAPS